MEVRDPPMMSLSASLSSKKFLHRLEMRRFPFEGSVLKMNELSEVDFERIREAHEQNIFPDSKRVAPPLFRGPSTRISSSSTNLTRPNEGMKAELARISDSQESNQNLDLNSNPGVFDDTRQADNNTEGFLAISRDPPESGKHTRSGDDSLAESDKSKGDWSAAGDDWPSAISRRQPKSEFDCFKPHDFESGKHDVALFL